VQALAKLNTEISLRRAALAELRSNFQERVTLNAVDRDYVYLTGEFIQPGRFELPFGRQATLADALYSDGGFSSKTANPSQIYVLRGAGTDTAMCHSVAS
jgi:polysaccharide export outer membrane protein